MCRSDLKLIGAQNYPNGFMIHRSRNYAITVTCHFDLTWDGGRLAAYETRAMYKSKRK
jgi:hypothetical protein